VTREVGRLGAVDYGRRRIGLAVCDALGITVRGLDTVLRPDRGPAAERDSQAVAAVARVLREEGVVRVVVGLPLHADGRESEMSAEARRFGDALAAALDREVLYFDEGLTSWEAEEGAKAAGLRLRDARLSGAIDRAAAVSILRSYLRHLESGAPPTAGADDDLD
jgi:putative Holliday junction resolvase